MKRYLAIWIVFLFSVSLPTAWGEEYQSKKYALGFYSGYSIGLGDAFKKYDFEVYRMQNKVTILFSGKFKYKFNRMVGAMGEIDYQRTKTDFKETYLELPPPKDITGYWFGILANIVVMLPEKEMTKPYIIPYLTTGGGIYLPKQGDAKPGLNFGGGFEHPFAENISVDIGGRFHTIFTEEKNTTYFQLRVGLNYLF